MASDRWRYKQHDLARFCPDLGVNTMGEGQGYPTSHPLPPTSRENLRLDGCFRVPTCREGTIHLLGLEPRTYGTADNGRPHVARIVQRFFVNHQIELFPWPAGSLSGSFADRKHAVHGCSTIDLDYAPNVWKLLSVCCTPRTRPKSL
ncbi:hypothetical protein TNCV_1189451 [Trichonephila clavipes]|nr:hypothetical protein TNCV_1189451 [Trichonephila clavipes]